MTLFLFLLIGCLASLINMHFSPQTVFPSEWFWAFCLMAATCVARDQESGDRCRLSAVPLVLLVLLLWSLLFGTSHAVGYWLYLAMALAALLLFQRADISRVALPLAYGLLACAVLQSLAGLCQLAGWDLDGLVMQKLYLQAFGNVGQANHYTNLVFLGLASLCYLASIGVFPWPVFLGVAAWLCLAAAASASRGAWLYTAAFAVLGLWARYRSHQPEVKRGGAMFLATAGFSVLAQLLVSYGNLLAAFGVTSSIARASDVGSNGQRLYDWHAAWLAVLEKPWLGEGPGTFYKLSIDAMAKTGEVPFSKFAEHAHNLPLQLAAEFGLPVAALALGGVAYWYGKHLCRKPAALSLWGLACIAVIGLHSMVEYPLWYSYFLIPLVLCVAVVDASDESLPSLRLPRWAAPVVGVAGLVVLGWVLHDWTAVRSAYEHLAPEGGSVSAEVSEEATEELRGVARYSVFGNIAEGLRLQAWRPESGGAEEVAQRCERTWPYKPGWYMMMRCGEAYAMAGYRAALDRLVMAACDGFPKHHAPLREWAERFDARGLASVKITGRACLRK